MKVLATNVYVGPNLYAHFPVIRQQIDLGILEQWPSEKLGNKFIDGLLEYPQYTRPAEYNGMKVPEVLLSGNHKRIKEWRKEQALARTKARRPDLFEK